MRRVTPAGVLLYTLASILLAACGEAAPTSMSTASAEPSLVTTSTTACEPRTRPGKIVEKVTTPRSWGIAVRDDGLTYFTEPFANGVGITSTATRTINGFIETGIDPIGAAFSPDGGTAYVTNLLSNTVSVLDVATAQQVGTISTGAASPFVVRVSPDGERLFVATNGNVVLVVATATREIVKSVEVGFAPNGFAVHPDGRIMYVSSFIGGTVSEVDIVTEQVLRTFFVGGTPQDMAVNRKGSRLYVANEQGYLNEIDLFSGEQLPRHSARGRRIRRRCYPGRRRGLRLGAGRRPGPGVQPADPQALENHRRRWRAAAPGVQPAGEDRGDREHGGLPDVREVARRAATPNRLAGAPARRFSAPLRSGPGSALPSGEA